MTNPGYAVPPATVAYFFTNRDAFRTDDITSTDLSLNYGFRFNSWGKDFEIFFQPEVLNVFNEDGVINVNQTVQLLKADGTAATPFNPFTTEPVEGVNWRKGPQFGQAINEFGYQQPRTFRFSVGLRFD